MRAEATFSRYELENVASARRVEAARKRYTNHIVMMQARLTALEPR